jgi:hypothetical protein
MKMSRSKLRELILQELSGSPRFARRNHGGWQGWTSGALKEIDIDIDNDEDADAIPDSDKPGQSERLCGSRESGGQIRLASRSLSPDIPGIDLLSSESVPQHAWIMIQEPGKKKWISLSGKSPVGLALGTFANKIARAISSSKSHARNANADMQVKQYLKDYLNGKELPKSIRDIADKTTWGTLEKIENWDSDTLGTVDRIWDITPKDPDVACKAISMILDGFDNYNGGVPYDPLPGIATRGTNMSRNSNSFAFTLRNLVTRAGGSVNMPGFNIEMFPGWGLTVPGLDTKYSMKDYAEEARAEPPPPPLDPGPAGSGSPRLHEISNTDFRIIIEDTVDEMISEKQMMSYNPTAYGGFEPTGLPKPVIHGKIVGAVSESDAIDKFIEMSDCDEGDYSITCTQGPGNSWSCIGNSADLGRENILDM